jgi:hypothetical protein
MIDKATSARSKKPLWINQKNDDSFDCLNPEDPEETEAKLRDTINYISGKLQESQKLFEIPDMDKQIGKLLDVFLSHHNKVLLATEDPDNFATFRSIRKDIISCRAMLSRYRFGSPS